MLDLGAGSGVIAGALAAVDARVRAIELDEAALRQLRSRFGAHPLVEVVAADATTVPLPREPFAVVSNLPFAAGTAILRRLLGDASVPLRQLDAIVEWGLAAKRTAVWPSTLLSCYWGAWYELSVVRRVPRAAFAPPPAVDAAVLRAVRRTEPLVPDAEAGGFLRLLEHGFGDRRGLRHVLPRRVLRTVAFANDAHARDLGPLEWAAVYRQLHGRR